MFQSKNLKIFSNAILIALISNICLAADPKYLPKGSVTEIDGFLFDVPRTQELRKVEIEHKTYKLLNESLNKSIVEQNNIITQERAKNTLLLDQNDKLAKSLNDARTTSDFTKILWFSLGIIVTGAAAYGASKITK